MVNHGEGTCRPLPHSHSAPSVPHHSRDLGNGAGQWPPAGLGMERLVSPARRTPGRAHRSRCRCVREASPQRRGARGSGSWWWRGSHQDSRCRTGSADGIHAMTLPENATTSPEQGWGMPLRPGLWWSDRGGEGLDRVRTVLGSSISPVFTHPGQPGQGGHTTTRKSVRSPPSLLSRELREGGEPCPACPGCPALGARVGHLKR